MMAKHSWWWITARHRETREKKTRIVKFTGPMPLKDELDFYCPPDVCYITEMKFSHNGDEWVDGSEEGQQELYEQMQKELNKKCAEIYGIKNNE